MEEEEKIDIRNHLIGWIDEFLKNGIVPQVVNPKAIKTNYVLKSKIQERYEQLKHYDYIETKELLKFICNEEE